MIIQKSLRASVVLLAVSGLLLALSGTAHAANTRTQVKFAERGARFDAVKRWNASRDVVAVNSVKTRFQAPNSVIAAEYAPAVAMDSRKIETQFRAAQIASTQRTITKLEASRASATSSTTRDARSRAVVDAQAYLAALKSPSVPITVTAEVLSGESGANARRSSPGKAVAGISRVRSIRKSRASKPAQPRAQAANFGYPDSYKPNERVFAPNYWDSTSELVDDEVPPSPIGSTPGRGGAYKSIYIGVQWHYPWSLNWYTHDNEGQRGFELEGFPVSENAQWSTDWHGSWTSNLPDAYRDDLSSDTVKHFAIGTPTASKLELDTYYWAEYETNEGQTDSGDVRIDGQATARPSDDDSYYGIQNDGYCASHQFADSACYFGRNNSEGYEYPLGSSISKFTGSNDPCRDAPGAYWIGGPDGDCAYQIW